LSASGDGILAVFCPPSACKLQKAAGVEAIEQTFNMSIMEMLSLDGDLMD
jgi:hypothetical protein